MRGHLDYLQDILNAIEDINSFVKGMDEEEFKDDKKTFLAVVKCFEIIGEAAKNVPKSVRNRYDAVLWKDVAGMRDKLSHAYFGIDIEVVWKAIQRDLPILNEQISRIMNDSKGER